MIKTCKNCKAQFEITREDLKFYDKVSPIFNKEKYQIPSPSLCPSCMQQRRLSFRNERNLYNRKCELSNKNIISIYSSESEVTVYNQHDWLERKKWDPKDYEKEFDFSRPFFEQFKKLLKCVPKKSINLFLDIENSDYCNQAWHIKNCYLCFNSAYSEDCYFSDTTLYSKNIVNSTDIKKSELIAHSFYCNNCYNSIYLENCGNCTDCLFSIDLKNCKHCILCSNLRNKEYCILNKEYSKEEYTEKKLKLEINKFSKFKDLVKQLKTIKNKAIHKENCNIQTENCFGNYLEQSKNLKNCFECFKTEDCKHVSNADNDVKDCCHVNNCAELELSYDCITIAGYRNLFSYMLIHSRECIYCDSCDYCNNCFACIGLKYKKYCILNKQYTKEEYEALVPKIIGHMKKPILRQGYEGQPTAEWGEFFPISLSPFAYNETLANDYFPLNKKDILEKNWKWKDNNEASKYQGIKYQIPDDINNVRNDILQAILICEISEKPYKIISQELKFYRKMNLPIPRKCPEQRHKDRMFIRNPRKLWERNCDKCKKEIKTTYAPNKPEIVYCEACYLKEIY